MSGKRIEPSPEEMNDKADEAPSRDEALIQSASRASNEMTVAFRPRISGLTSDLVRTGGPAFEPGPDDTEETHYHFTSASNESASQAFPTDTTLRIIPIDKSYHRGKQGGEEVPQYEFTQNGLKFRGNAKGIKFVVNQVTSKGDPYVSERQQSQGQGKQDRGFVNQSGALFSQSVSDSEGEVRQCVDGKELYKIDQDAVEVEGEAFKCSFNTIDQRIW